MNPANLPPLLTPSHRRCYRNSLRITRHLDLANIRGHEETAYHLLARGNLPILPLAMKLLYLTILTRAIVNPAGQCNGHQLRHILYARNPFTPLIPSLSHQTVSSPQTVGHRNHTILLCPFVPKDLAAAHYQSLPVR